MNWKVVEKGNNLGALIKVVGVGGCGGNAVDHMVKSGLENVETISINTDSQALDASVAEVKHCLGEISNSGQGAGANPDIGRDTALDDYERIEALLKKQPNSEPTIIRKRTQIKPNNSINFRGNSLPIREWQFAATQSDKGNDFYANRGVNGIDGNISTFLGISKDYNNSFGIFGDLTTIYDLN